MSSPNDSNYMRHFIHHKNITPRNFVITQSQKLREVTKTNKCPIIQRTTNDQNYSNYFLFHRPSETSDIHSVSLKTFQSTAKSREILNERNVQGLKLQKTIRVFIEAV